MTKSSAKKRQEAQQFLNRLKGYINAFAITGNKIKNDIQTKGTTENHWDKKFGSYEDYINEDFDKGTETEADQELQIRIDGVSDVFSNVVISDFYELMRYETSWGNRQNQYGRFKNYLDDTTHHNTTEQYFLNEAVNKNKLAEMLAWSAGTGGGGGTGTNALPIVSINGFRLIGFDETTTITETPIFGIGWKLIGFETP